MQDPVSEDHTHLQHISQIAGKECPLRLLHLSACRKLWYLRLDLKISHAIPWVRDILFYILRRESPVFLLCVDLTIEVGDIPDTGAWDGILSTYSPRHIYSSLDYGVAQSPGGRMEPMYSNAGDC